VRIQVSNLSSADRQYLEALLDMGSGYVLDFSDQTFAEFFDRHSIDIDSDRYRRYGHSKAKRMRAFWDLEPDSVVGPVLSEMIDKCEAQRQLGQRKLDLALVARAKKIASRLSGSAGKQNAITTQGFLDVDFQIPDLKNLPIDPLVSDIIRSRLDEIAQCLRAEAHMAVVFLCGSVLEAVLLGAAGQESRRFNESPRSPRRDDGKPKQFHNWRLSELIDVASDVGLLKPDVQKFSHGIRDFRNYIHPYQQLSSGFTPDNHTARLCFQALKAALADVAGER
jgi:hypothetical protein